MLAREVLTTGSSGRIQALQSSVLPAGIDVIARAMSNAILSGKGAQLVPLIADAAGYPGVLSAWSSVSNIYQQRYTLRWLLLDECGGGWQGYL